MFSTAFKKKQKKKKYANLRIGYEQEDECSKKRRKHLERYRHMCVCFENAVCQNVAVSSSYKGIKELNMSVIVKRLQWTRAHLQASSTVLQLLIQCDFQGRRYMRRGRKSGSIRTIFNSQSTSLYQISLDYLKNSGPQVERLKTRRRWTEGQRSFNGFRK